MCILRYLPATVPSLSITTAVLWYRPGARRSKSDVTMTTPHFRANSPNISVRRAGYRLGKVEVADVFRLAEVERVVQFLEHDQLCPAPRKVGHALGKPHDVVARVGRVVLLQEAYVEFFHLFLVGGKIVLSF